MATDYPSTTDINGKAIRIHVVIWQAAHGPIPKGHDIHHKNGIKYDNRLENLELLTERDHTRITQGWIKEDDEWPKPCNGCGEYKPLSEFYLRASGKHVYRCKLCSSLQFLRWYKKQPRKTGRRVHNSKSSLVESVIKPDIDSCNGD